MRHLLRTPIVRQLALPCVLLGYVTLGNACPAAAGSPEPNAPVQKSRWLASGEVHLSFARPAERVSPSSHPQDLQVVDRVTGTGRDTSLAVTIVTWDELDTGGEDARRLRLSAVETMGAFLFGPGPYLHAAYDISLTLQDGRWVVTSAGPYGRSRVDAFTLEDVTMSTTHGDESGTESVNLAGRLRLSAGLANIIGMEPGGVVGRLDAAFEITAPAVEEGDPGPTGEVAGSIGPDIIVGELHQTTSWGNIGPIHAFSVGTISCNAGDEPVDWYPNTQDHPVIAQNMYRLKNGRYEQLGLSWVKHGFSTLTGDACDFGCIPPPGGSQQLGIGCSDPYSADLNGNQFYLGPRSEINAFTGAFPYPFSAPPAQTTIGRRIQVWGPDLEPNLNIGAKYFVEGQYVSADDAGAGNQGNNTAYRQIYVFVDEDTYSLSFADFTRSQQPGIRAWKEQDPSVTLNGTSIVGDGTIWIGSKATDLGNGWWHYEYAVHNVNSHRSAGSFAVPLPGGVSVDNIGFHDIDYHSGEPYSTLDWTATVAGNAVTWSTESYAVNQNANAIRWGTLYNFRFDATTPPVSGTVSVGYFRPGTPSTTSTFAQIPATPVPVCGDDFVGVGEECDPPDGVHCDAECQWICGDGVIQAGEECEPPDGVTCDSECQIIYICGDGAVDPDEDCDPPNGVTCDENCQRIPICGDSILDPGETCDPPNGVTCDDACQRIDNDDCVTATPICPGLFLTTLAGATSDGDASCANTPNAPDHWFSYTPLVDGLLSLETCGSALNTVLSVHTSCSGSPLDELACNDDGCSAQSTLTLPVTAGETYLIRVAGTNGGIGTFRLTVDGPICETGPPENSECLSAIPALEGSTVFTTNQSGTDGPDEPSSCAALPGTLLESDIWYCVQPSCAGTVEFRLCDTDFDAALAVYAGCTCPPSGAAAACDVSDCGGPSTVSVANGAGDSFLVRIGSPTGMTGTGRLEVVCQGAGDAIRGGKRYDRWWVAADVAEPAGEHPLYPMAGMASGSDTFRCQECHGWDYEGVDGVYGSGVHFTGIPGVLGSALSADAMFELLRGTGIANGHGYETYGLTHQDIWDLVSFVQSLTIDTSAYIDNGGAFLGDEIQGEINFTSGGVLPCIACHGAEGININFGTDAEPEWIGTVATYDPWKLLHKIRFGQPGAPMPSWLDGGGMDQGAADIGRYAQLNFPVDCLSTETCDDGLYCTGQESCTDGFCVTDGEPCSGSLCDEALQACLSGTCPPPEAIAAGSRYVTVIPAAGTGPVALWFDGDPDDEDAGCVELYVQANGRLGPDPVFLTPDAWGTVQVADTELLQGSGYTVRSDCGQAGLTDFSTGVGVTTWSYGDVTQNGVANFDDIFAIVMGFQGTFAYPLEAMDIAACAPDGAINFGDIQVAVLAFQGVLADCPLPCR